MGSFSEDKSNFKTKIFLAGFLSVAALNAVFNVCI